MFSACLHFALVCGSGGAPSDAGELARVVRQPVPPRERLDQLGLSVSTAAAGEFNTVLFRGAKVDSVRPGSRAARAGLRVGDVIVEADGRDLSKAPFKEEEVLGEALNGSGKVRLYVSHGVEFASPMEYMSISLP